MLEDFRVVWEKAAEAAGRPGLLFHDFRRSFVRNATRAGIPSTVVRATSGHLANSIFDSYNITDECDLRTLADKVEKYAEDFVRRPEAHREGDRVAN